MTARDSFGVRRPLEPPVGMAPEVRCATILEEPLARVAALAELEHWLERDTMPIPATNDREYYYDDRHFEYWLSGLDDCLKIQDPDAYIRRIWGRVFTVADIQPIRHGFQSAVILRKDAHATD